LTAARTVCEPRRADKPAEAETLYREALATRRKVLGPEDTSTIGSLHNLGDLLTKQGKDVTNYDDQANQSLAKNLKGHLLLAHGAMDDNVPPNNTLLVVDALIKANKDFDLLMLPNQRHGYGSAGNYMTRRRWDYFVRYLLGAEPPSNYQMRPPDVRPAP